MKVAILGASGDIGAYLTRYLLKKGYEVVPIVRNSLGPQLSRFNLKPVIADFLSQSSLTKAIGDCDVVVNCVVEKGGPKRLLPPVEANIQISLNILRACQHKKVRRLIHFSSIAVLPPRVTAEVLRNPYRYSTETDDYTISKVESEKLFLKATEKMSVVVIRPGIVYGPNMSWSRSVFSKAKKTKIILPSQEGRCYAVHPVDLSRLVDAIIKTNLDSGLFYGINPEKVSWREFYLSHGASIKIVSERMIRLEHLKNKIRKKVPKGISWFFNHPVIGAPLRLKVSHQIGKRVVDSYLISSEIMTKTISEVYPTSAELELYLSSAKMVRDAEMGQSLGFKYEIGFEAGVKGVLDWMNFEYAN